MKPRIEALAEVLRDHRTYMGAFERGERNLSLRSVERIAARIGVESVALLVEPEQFRMIERNLEAVAPGRSAGPKEIRP